MEQDAFGELYAATARPLWMYIRRAVGRVDVADELTQEAFVRLLTVRRLSDMTDAHRRHYLFRIAANLIRDHFRARARLEPASGAEPATEVEQSHLSDRDLVARTLEQLRPKDRQLLWLAYAEGASHGEIAARTGYTVGSIRPLLHRAKKRALKTLRRLLDPRSVSIARREMSMGSVCASSNDVRNAAHTGHWTPGLMRHADRCDRCAGLVLTAGIETLAQDGASHATFADPTLIWWKGLAARRLIAVEKATRPIATVQMILSVAGVLLAMAAIVASVLATPSLVSDMAAFGLVVLSVPLVMVAAAAAAAVRFR